MIYRMIGLVTGISCSLLLAIHAYYYLSGQESPLQGWLGPLILLTILSSSLLRLARQRPEK
jgi:hypothetical protein